MHLNFHRKLNSNVGLFSSLFGLSAPSAVKMRYNFLHFLQGKSALKITKVDIWPKLRPKVINSWSIKWSQNFDLLPEVPFLCPKRVTFGKKSSSSRPKPPKMLKSKFWDQIKNVENKPTLEFHFPWKPKCASRWFEFWVPGLIPLTNFSDLKVCYYSRGWHLHILTIFCCSSTVAKVL